MPLHFRLNGFSLCPLMVTFNVICAPVVITNVVGSLVIVVDKGVSTIPIPL